MIKRRFYFITAILFLIVFSGGGVRVYSQNDQFNCFSVLVGKKATVNGAVMFAHNEDDGGKQVVNWYKVPALKHTLREDVSLKNGGKVPQVLQTQAYLWLEMPGMNFSDSYVNESGVCVASDACASKEDKPAYTDGGIGYFLRRLIAERAHSAREAVKIGGALVSGYGYTSSGRTYCIAGPEETWMLSVVKGKHWVAERIPDDEVAIMPNYYTITKVDMKDTLNFYGSPDLIDYAVRRGWYHPDTDGTFNFRKVYGRKGSLKTRGNISREWIVLNMLSQKQYSLDDTFPFSFKPAEKVSLTMLMQVLRNHYEGTKLDLTNGYASGSPHTTKERPVCARSTQYGFVTEIRDWMPSAIGTVMWIAPRRPCTQAFTPWYVGIVKTPEEYRYESYTKAMKNHFHPKKKQYTPEFAPAYYSFSGFSEYADSNYAAVITKVKPANLKFEMNIIKNQANFERMILAVYQKDTGKAKQMLTDFTSQIAQENLKRNQARKNSIK